MVLVDYRLNAFIMASSASTVSNKDLKEPRTNETEVDNRNASLAAKGPISPHSWRINDPRPQMRSRENTDLDSYYVSDRRLGLRTITETQ